MNLIICDDDVQFLHALEEKIRKKTTSELPDADILCFSSGNALLNWYIQGGHPIDMLLIDVEMPGYSGLDIIKKLRKSGCSCLSVFISAYQEYVMPALDYGIVNFIQKPVNPEKLDHVITQLFTQYKLQHHDVKIVCDNATIILPVEQIIFVESKFRKLIYTTCKRQYETTGSISATEKALVPWNFIRSHKSFLVNMNKIVSYKGFTFYLTGGYTAEIGQSRRAKVISTYEDWLQRKLISTSPV